MKIKGKVFKVGNSYGIRIKKALIDAEIFMEGQEVELIPQQETISQNFKKENKSQTGVMRERFNPVRYETNFFDRVSEFVI